MNEVIYRGLRIKTNKCRYFQVVEGDIPSIVEDERDLTITLTYSPNSSAKSLSISLGLDLIGPGKMKMTPTYGVKKFSKTYVSLNGLRLEKLTYDSHIINVVIVRDSKSRVIQTYNRTTFVINRDDYKNPEFIEFLFYSGNLLYLRPVGPRVKCYKIFNFPKIIVGDRNLDLHSENSNIYSLRNRYNDYLIREIDYQDQFILELRRILENYGVELVRLNKEKTLENTSYITYQVNQTPMRDVQFGGRLDGEENIIGYKQPIEFSLHTPDMVLYHDFKNRYINVMLLTNFTEFKTTDKAGDRWTAAVKWGSITEDFNHTYQADDNSNFAFQCQFRCEIHFYSVLDTRYEFLSEILMELQNEDAENEEKSIKQK